MLYQIKCHPKLSEHYNKCSEYLYRFAHQTQPPDMDYKEWCKHKITENKVIAYLKNVISKQNAPIPQDKIALVKQKYNFVYKGYSSKSKAALTEEQKKPVPIYDIVSGACFDEFPGYEKLIRKKQNEYARENAQFEDMTEDAEIKNWLDNFTLWDSENEEDIYLNPIQKHDLNLILQKRYGLLQWEQGSGKTLAGIAVGKYRMEKQNIHHTWVTSSAISIRNNWDVVLETYGLSYVFVEKLTDLQRIKKGDFVIITLNMLSKYRKQIKRWVRIHNQKIQLVFDESDEMSNPNTATAKSVLDCFRRCKSKLLTTGTSTRNKDTAEYTCKRQNIVPIILPWTSEHAAFVRQITRENTLSFRFSFEKGVEDFKESCNDYTENYFKLIEETDMFLEAQGYKRQGAYYKITEPNEKHIAIFCHGGFGTAFTAHLLGLPPAVGFSSMFMTTSSVTTFEFKDYNQNGFTRPRMIRFGETAHLQLKGLNSDLVTTCL